MGFLVPASKTCTVLCQCCPAGCTCTSLADNCLFPWNYSQSKTWVLSSPRAVVGHLPGSANGQASYFANRWSGYRQPGEHMCSKDIKVRISQARMSELLCPTYPTVSWINERESLDRAVLWVHLVGEERDVFFCICTGGAFEGSQNKLPHLGNGLNRLAGCESIFNVCKEKITVCRCTAFHLFFLYKFLLQPSS